MKYLLFLLLSCCISFTALSQGKCDLSSLSKTDKTLLQNFWADLKVAIKERDKDKLAALCAFPFTCSFCQEMGPTNVNQPYVTVTRKEFDVYFYKIFSDKKLEKEVAQYKLPEEFIIITHFNTKDKRCSYSFAYTVFEETDKHPGKQYLFDIQKVNENFKITAAWAIP
ncbi:hypothetical protein [Rufibacter sp. LB8]|uniref:hypothetical protein n=1 Tax=Rufibacter sp. LB8 TaxID=2777781 RepID=UPI00178C515C|nr:hypothetical protein [Rufibacter sp. LB8]